MNRIRTLPFTTKCILISSLFIAIAATIVIPLASKAAATGPGDLLFSNFSTWPTYMRSYLPLNLAVAYGMGVALSVAFIKGLIGGVNLLEMGYPKLMLGVFMGFGSLFGLMMVIMGGWFRGLEVGIVFGAGVACLIGLFWAADFIMHRLDVRRMAAPFRNIQPEDFNDPEER